MARLALRCWTSGMGRTTRRTRPVLRGVLFATLVALAVVVGFAAVVAKPALDELVGLHELVVEDHHLPGQRAHDVGSHVLAGDGGVLCFSGLGGPGGKFVDAPDLAVAQPGGKVPPTARC